MTVTRNNDFFMATMILDSQKNLTANNQERIVQINSMDHISKKIQVLMIYIQCTGIKNLTRKLILTIYSRSSPKK